MLQQRSKHPREKVITPKASTSLFGVVFQELKSRMNRFRDAEGRRLIGLTPQVNLSDATETHLHCNPVLFRIVSQELKSRMNRFRDAEGRRLMELTVNSQASVKALKDKQDKAERILKLAEVKLIASTVI